MGFFGLNLMAVRYPHLSSPDYLSDCDPGGGCYVCCREENLMTIIWLSTYRSTKNARALPPSPEHKFQPIPLAVVGGIVFRAQLFDFTSVPEEQVMQPPMKHGLPRIKERIRARQYPVETFSLDVICNLFFSPFSILCFVLYVCCPLKPFAVFWGFSLVLKGFVPRVLDFLCVLFFDLILNFC